jgi:hypothetical protein
MKTDTDGNTMKTDTDGNTMKTDTDGNTMKTDTDGNTMKTDTDGNTMKTDTDGNTMKTDTDGNTLLHIAVYEDYKEIFDSLPENYRKQMINTENKKGKTPLHIAAKLDRDEIAMKLIKK